MPTTTPSTPCPAPTRTSTARPAAVRPGWSSAACGPRRAATAPTSSPTTPRCWSGWWPSGPPAPDSAVLGDGLGLVALLGGPPGHLLVRSVVGQQEQAGHQGQRHHHHEHLVPATLVREDHRNRLYGGR